MGLAPNGRLFKFPEGMAMAEAPASAAEERCRDIESLKPNPRYLFCRCDTIVSMSVAGVSGASATIADVDFRSPFAALDGAGGGSMRTSSTVKGDGVKSARITAGEVPGGRDERCKVGFAAAFVSL